MKTVADGDGLFAPMWNAIASLWLSGTAVLSGCQAVGDVGALSVSVWGGTIAIGGTTRTVTGQICSVGANTGTETRYDLLSFDSSGFANVTTGTTSCPAIPANSVPIAILEVQPGQTSMPADRVHDCRALAALPIANVLLGVSLQTTAYTLIPSERSDQWAGNRLYYDNSTVSKTEAGGGYQTAKTAPAVPANQSGTIRVRYDVVSVTSTAYAQLTKNGSAIAGTEITATSGTTTTSTYDVAVAAGDVLAVQVHESYAGNVVRNTVFEILAHPVPTYAGVAWS